MSLFVNYYCLMTCERIKENLTVFAMANVSSLPKWYQILIKSLGIEPHC